MNYETVSYSHIFHFCAKQKRDALKWNRSVNTL